MALIQVINLVKEYSLNKKKSGFKGIFENLVAPEKINVRAVDNISFFIERGEIVGYIGPNGAGKSTTIKILCGILHPTSGIVSIDGDSPHRERKTVVKKIGAVFGQRTQLYWELRLWETFELLKRVYQIKEQTYRENLETMNEVMRINELMDVPVRQLSLGQRMRADLAAAMLHSPSILLLDEPTIGLDVEAKHAIRKFIREINQKFEVTVLLTTHDLDDIQQLCSRVIMINQGKIVQDGPLHMLVDDLAPYRTLIVDLVEPQINLNREDIKLIKQEENRFWLSFHKEHLTAVDLISDLSKGNSIKDFSLQEPNIDDLVISIYRRNS